LEIIPKNQKIIYGFASKEKFNKDFYPRNQRRRAIVSVNSNILVQT